MHQKSVIGLHGTTLTAEEQRRLASHPPQGVILFARNIESPEQIRNLLDQVRQCTGQNSWAAIDEEGGRVNRLPWPPFNNRSHAADLGAMFRQDELKGLNSIAEEAAEAAAALAELGFTHNCAPDLDVFHPAGHDIIGKRAFSDNPEIVIACANACLDAMQAAGIEGIGKHFPGHGRANADSHLALPEVDADMLTLMCEAAPFSQARIPGLKHIMTAHVRYPAVDSEIATFSKTWLQHVLRDELAFNGLIWSDDLCMKAVGDNVVQAAEKAEQAGCDILLICQPDGVDQFYQQL